MYKVLTPNIKPPILILMALWVSSGLIWLLRGAMGFKLDGHTINIANGQLAIALSIVYPVRFEFLVMWSNPWHAHSWEVDAWGEILLVHSVMTLVQ